MEYLNQSQPNHVHQTHPVHALICRSEGLLEVLGHLSVKQSMVWYETAV